MMQKKVIIILILAIIISVSVLFSGCIDTEDKQDEVPNLFKDLSDEPWKGDILWISSVPLGAEVYVANINELYWPDPRWGPSTSDVEKEECYKGTTPLSVEINPGRYVILFKVKAEKFEACSSVYEYMQEKSKYLKTYIPDEGYTGEEPTITTGDLFVHDFDGKYMTGEAYKDKKIEYFTRAYIIDKGIKQNTHIGLFQPVDATYDELYSLLPRNENFVFKNIEDPLKEYNIPSSDIPKISKILSHGGKFIWTYNKTQMLVIKSKYPEGWGVYLYRQ